MSLIQWDASLSVHIPELDRQHQMLVNHINGLYEAMNAGRDRLFLAVLIGRLAVYAAFHFAKEEHYFEAMGYPEADRHARQHEAFEQRISLFESDYRDGREDLTLAVLNFLCEWLVDHIEGSDRLYADFFRNRGDA